MKQVNLLPPIEQRELKLRFLANRLATFWFWVLVSLAVFFFLALATRFYLDGQIKDTQYFINQDNLVLQSSDYKDLQNQILLLNRNIKEIKNLQTQHYYWSNALIQLSNLIPADMQLNQIDFDKTSGEIQIVGQAKNRDSVIALWANVIKSQYFKKINFPLTNLEKAENADFTFTFYVNPEKFKSE